MKQIEMEAEIRKMREQRNAERESLVNWGGQIRSRIDEKESLITQLRSEVHKLRAEWKGIDLQVSAINRKWQEKIAAYRAEVEPTLEKPALQEMSAWALVKELERRGYDVEQMKEDLHKSQEI
jgi:predicted  nucleic acid-binding Zn-ribbon protein